MSERNILQSNYFIMESNALTKISMESGNSEQTFY
jgi:hypothetical protein